MLLSLNAVNRRHRRYYLTWNCQNGLLQKCGHIFIGWAWFKVCANIYIRHIFNSVNSVTTFYR